jgi:hypothetical protein
MNRKELEELRQKPLTVLLALLLGPGLFCWILMGSAMAWQGWNGEGLVGELVGPGWLGVVVGIAAGAMLPLWSVAALWLMFLAFNSRKKMAALSTLIGLAWLIKALMLPTWSDSATFLLGPIKLIGVGAIVSLALWLVQKLRQRKKSTQA